MQIVSVDLLTYIDVFHYTDINETENSLDMVSKFDSESLANMIIPIDSGFITILYKELYS